MENVSPTGKVGIYRCAVAQMMILMMMSVVVTILKKMEFRFPLFLIRNFGISVRWILVLHQCSIHDMQKFPNINEIFYLKFHIKMLKITIL